MATTVHRPTRTTWHAATSGPAFAPRPGRRIVVHRRSKPGHVSVFATVATETESTPPPQVRITYATPQESADLFDARARRELGVSGREFLRRWNAGEYADASDRDQHGRAVYRLATLIPTIHAADLP